MTYLLDQLSHEIGRDAREEANRRHPELQNIPDQHAQELVAAVDFVIKAQNWPRTAENAERAYLVLEATGELARMSEQYASAPAASPDGFTPRSDEQEFLQQGPLEQVADYLRSK